MTVFLLKWANKMDFGRLVVAVRRRTYSVVSKVRFSLKVCLLKDFLNLNKVKIRTASEHDLFALNDNVNIYFNRKLN